MVDVAGGADRQRHARTAAATASSSSSASVRQSSSSRPSRTIPTTAGSCSRRRAGERLLERARERRELGERQRAAADARDGLLDLAVHRAREPLGPGAHRQRVLVEHAEHRHLRERTHGVEVEEQRALERGEPELVDAQRAMQRMAPQPLDQVGAAEDDTGLRAAEQLVAAEADEVGALLERGARGRLVAEVDERAGAEIVEQRQLVPARDRGELAQRRALGEPDEAEVGLVHAQEQRRVCAGRRVVVGRARAVRRPDLDQARAGAFEHLGDAEAVADLDQLAARHEHLAAVGERGKREQQRGGVVVDDERRLGAGEPPQQCGDVVLARASRTAGEVELEVRVAAPALERPRERGPASGARPRFVCTITPVAFSTRRSDGPPRLREPLDQPGGRSPGSRPARMSSRARGEDRCGPRRSPAGRRLPRASSSTDGRFRSSTFSSDARFVGKRCMGL